MSNIDTTTPTTIPVAPIVPSAEDFLKEITDLAGGLVTPKSGANYLLGYVYPQRIVKGNVSGVTIPTTDYETFRGGGGTTQKYSGPLLVDRNGNISREQYDLSQQGDANTILLDILNRDPLRYRAYTSLLQTRGYYGNAKPSTNRVDSIDRSAMSEFLNNVANANGVTYDVAFQILESKPQVTAAGTRAPSVRVTSDDDLKVVFRKASTDLLGYEVDDVTAQKFARSYRQMEIAEGRKQEAGGVYESAAAPSTVAEQQIRQQFGAEVKAVQAGNFAEVMDARIKQLGA